MLASDKQEEKGQVAGEWPFEPERQPAMSGTSAEKEVVREA